MTDNFNDFYGLEELEKIKEPSKHVESRKNSKLKLKNNVSIPESNVFDEQYFTDSLYERSDTDVKRNNDSERYVVETNLIENQYFGAFESNTNAKKISSEQLDTLINSSHSNKRDVKTNRTMDDDHKSETLQNKSAYIKTDQPYGHVGILEHQNSNMQAFSQTKPFRLDEECTSNLKVRKGTGSKFFNELDAQYFPDFINSSGENVQRPEVALGGTEVKEENTRPQFLCSLKRNAKGSTYRFKRKQKEPSVGENMSEYAGVSLERLQQPVTAYDAVMRMKLLKRGQAKELSSQVKSAEIDFPLINVGSFDSQGFHRPTADVPDWQHESIEVVTKVLKDRIIYDKHNIVAVNKPYGLPCHGGPGIAMSVAHALTALSSQISDDPLHMLHRLDRNTTGVLVLARNAQTAFRIQAMFKRNEIIKRYLAICRNVPSPKEGLIDIPLLGMKMSDGHYKMVTRPEAERSKQSSKLSGRRAITEYKVLSEHQSAALVQVAPKTGVKHQIRAHLSQGLNAAIMGDHKYSHISKLLPQRLPGDMLQQLHVRQPQVRHMPLHLHARELVLPQFHEGRNVFIRAGLPKFFTKNMRRLKLFIPR